MKKIVPLLFLAFFGHTRLTATPAESPVKKHVIMGTVFLDANKNGIREKSERTLKNISVSNGTTIVTSNKKGVFTLHSYTGQTIFPILPTGYISSHSSSKIENTKFRYIDPAQMNPDTIIVDIPLVKEVQPSIFRIGAIGDVQVDTEEELSYASKSIFTELTQREDLQFNLILGDLVNDKMPLMPAVRAVMDKTNARYWTVLGNHDRNSESTHLNDVFTRNMGADTYAFNYGGVHFIVLNNVFATGNRSYEGRVTADQLTFLAADLKRVSKHTTIVLSQHIPMAFTHNQKEVLALLEGYQKVLILTGHTHNVNRYFFDNEHIHELGAGATCGNWWRGEKDRDGVPDALMQCGTPRGYFTIDFDKNDYHIRFKGVGLDAQHQMRLMMDSTHLILNVFGGSKYTDVQVQIDSSAWMPMQKTSRVDPLVGDTRNKNQSKVYPTAGNTRNPLGTKESSHIWQMETPTAYKSKICRIRVHAKDRFGFAAEQEFMMHMP
ncbi:calcineurin-like phosphoesterase C-terminal domain-containing protein [Sphingobacterium psychroaquaticum]|uniref:3',5'-cyclic AMP phosphodiesterase CpdA n=1 Tax=Sphingobacterium psychroaquaticum TaxID=561061 RepID=A0A1X7LBS2_9SPHI|nr:calcineurin-like phosphoesterase C-terminal domain-containing protein [Sphingobacterium psychroaquaticum]SMG51150.1 3',5'-cyclic AMP phosphodiesterase CpdA [Sphingobacterium psychroaquaticum]